MNHEARRRLGELLAHIYRDHLRENSHCLSMEDRKAAIEDMETTLYKVRNIIGSIRYSELLYLKNTIAPTVSLEENEETLALNLKKAGQEAGDGTAADHLRILLDKPSVVYMSLTTGAPNSALVVNEDNKEIDMNMFYRSVLKDTTPGTCIFLVTGSEYPLKNAELVNVISGNAQNQNIMINIILLDPKYISDESKVMYQTMALVTGGLLYQTARREATQLIPIIESRFQPDQVTIVRNQRIPTQARGSYIDVPVDSTMSELLFEIYCPQLNSLQIYNPRYRPQRDIQTLVAASDNYLYSIKNVEPGNWQAIVDCKTDFYIEVRGQSPVDFFFTFASSDNNFKPTSPFGLNPRSVPSSTANSDDKKYLLVHSLGVENVELQSVQFKQDDAKYNHNERVLPLYLVESLVSAFPMPVDADYDETAIDSDHQPIQMARIEGIDQSGFPVLRTHVLFPAKLLLLTDLERTDFLPAADTNVTVRITNAYKDISVSAADFENWVTNVTPTSTGKSYYTDITITMRPPSSVEQGKMSTVTLTAQSTETNQLLGSLTFEVAAGQRARPTIESLHIDTEINNKMAVTSVKSNIRNDHPEAREATFDALIPPNALITGLKLYVNGDVFNSEIKPAKQSDDSKTNKKSPITMTPSPADHHPHDHGIGGNLKGLNAAHILQRDAHRYEIKMIIDSWDNVTFELTYEELLERSQDRYQHWVSIAPSQVVQDLTTNVRVTDLGGIKWIRAYPVQSGLNTKVI